MFPPGLPRLALLLLRASVRFALDALALALLGPGAYSPDSRRSGRRLVVLPPA